MHNNPKSRPAPALCRLGKPIGIEGIAAIFEEGLPTAITAPGDVMGNARQNDMGKRAMRKLIAAWSSAEIKGSWHLAPQLNSQRCALH
jgi:hypothetical protein